MDRHLLPTFFCFFLVLFLFSCFYHVLYLSLSLNLKTFIPLPPIFLYTIRWQRYNNGVTFFFVTFASLFKMESGSFGNNLPINFQTK